MIVADTGPAGCDLVDAEASAGARQACQPTQARAHDRNPAPVTFPVLRRRTARRKGRTVGTSRKQLSLVGTGMVVRLGCLLTAMVLASTACAGQTATCLLYTSPSPR